MSDTESVDYLQTGFDPTSLTVPRIRSILVAHDIEYPSGAKKPQLIQIFNDNILPQARKILTARARVRRISKGIVDADSQDSSIADEELMPPPPTPRVRSRKTATRLKSEESESDLPVSRSPAKRTPRASSKHARPSDTETGTDIDGTVKKAARTSRKSPAPPTPSPAPKVKDEDLDDEVPVSRIAPRRESAFTYDNPFQSGSSPLDGAKLASGEKKRRSLGSSTGRDSSRRKTTPARRRTDGPTPDDDIHPPTSSTFEIPISELNGITDVDENGVVIDEEFTPEEQLELTLQRAANGVDALGPRRPKRQESRGFSWRGPLLVLVLALTGGYAAWYRQEKLAVGYCGVGREAVQVIPMGVNVPDWARILVEPDCEPCPRHAYCSRNLETHCELDFVLKPHPLSVAGLIPLPPSCEPDGEKARRVKAVADRAVEELRERRAKWECGLITSETGLPVTVEIDAEELKKEVGEKRRKGMTEAEFEDLWGAAIGEIEGREEVVTVADGTRIHLTSTSLARLPLGCTIRRSFRLTLARHSLKLISLALLVGSYFYARHYLASRRAAKAAIPNLVALTLERLATQATLHVQDKEGVPENWISIGQLRDDVLRSEHSLRKREAIWQSVKRVVAMNSNVRESQRQGRNGEISRVWEWIGALGELEGSERRRKSGGRVSWGVYDERSSPVSGSDGGPEIVQQKWQEGRPIY